MPYGQGATGERVYGSIIAQIVFVLVPSLWYVRRLLRRLTPSHAEAELVS
jgi:hypothetical protein